MDHSKIIDTLTESSYFQGCLENLLNLLQPPFYCLKLISRILLHGPDGSGKRLLAKTTAKHLNLNFFEERVADMFDDNLVGIEKKIRDALSKAATSAPCLIYLTGFELFSKPDDSDLCRIEECIRDTLGALLTDDSSQPVVLIYATNDSHSVYNGSLSNIFQQYIPLKSPTLQQAEEMVNFTKTELQLKSKSLLNACPRGEYYIGNIMNAIALTELTSFKQTTRDGHKDNEEDSNDIDGTRWADVGGLSDVKQEIVDAIQLSTDFPQLKKSGLSRTGILLYGPPGTGKTLLAKAVATECSLNFINVKGPELLNEYVGQSEDNVRKLFQRARESSPSVIFFDELDSLAPSRGQAGDSGGVMDRMVSQLLAEMDGVGKSGDVFVIGATNRVDLVDSSLLRPGRFDKILEVPLPSSKENRLQILKALTRKMKLSEDVDLDKLESITRSDMSGADFQGLCSRAMHKTFDRCIELVESGALSEEEAEFVTTMDDFVNSIDE